MIPRSVPFFPEQASDLAQPVDRLYFYLTAISALMALALALMVIGFAVVYRRRHSREVPAQGKGNNRLEIGWTLGALFIFLTMFFWSAAVYFRMQAPPDSAIEMYAVGKQWMWKVQHPGGQREINQLHIPVGTPVRITLTSQDVIHSFYVPAFRVKQDAVPGRYTTLWFTATKPGRYHLFCAEYCGTEHSGMIGYVYAMDPADYSTWLSTGGAEGSLSSKGQKLFQQFGCNVCHDLVGHGPAPGLRDVFGSLVQLADGSSVIADEAYIRESILVPKAKIVYGFNPIMPVFQGQLTEDQVMQLVAYIRALARGQFSVQAPGAGNIAGTVPEER